MANSILTAVYNQYLTTYVPKRNDNRYDIHKRSELKSITNSMAKVNRDAPLYKLDNSEDTKQFIVGLKEGARNFQNTIIELSSDAENIDINAKVAYSSDENVISAKYIGEASPSLEEIPTFDISVEQLASPQVNLGNYLPKNSKSINPGEYAFDLTVSGSAYEFQYGIHEEDTNFDIQSRLCRLINESNIGLSATIEEDAENNSALRIVSNRTGVDFGQNPKVFNITDANMGLKAGTVEYLGLNHVAREASNAHFTVNGIDASSISNSFILQKQYEITLNGISPNEGQTVTVGVKPDTEALKDNVTSLLGSYNEFIKSIDAYRQTQSRSSALITELGNISNAFHDELSQIGISRTEDGQLQLDGKHFDSVVTEENSREMISSLKDFSSAMLRKSKQISLNPVSYLNKTVVAYKNPGHNHFAPYVSSAYAGMFFNSYC